MHISIRERFRSATTAWNRHLIILACSVFAARLGQGLFGGASTNFLVDVLGLSGTAEEHDNFMRYGDAHGVGLPGGKHGGEV